MSKVALAGEPTPVAGTAYGRFFGPPDSNASDQVLFGASAGRTIDFDGLFLFDPVGATITKVVATGDGAPSGGTFRTITNPNLTDGNRAGFRAHIDNDPSAQGVFLF